MSIRGTICASHVHTHTHVPKKAPLEEAFVVCESSHKAQSQLAQIPEGRESSSRRLRHWQQCVRQQNVPAPGPRWSPPLYFLLSALVTFFPPYTLRSKCFYEFTPREKLEFGCNLQIMRTKSQEKCDLCFHFPLQAVLSQIFCDSQ